MQKEYVLIPLYPGCISFEVALAAELLSRKFGVVTATPDGQDVREMSGLPVRAQLSYAQVDMANCRAVIVPGGDPGSLVGNSEIDRILVEAHT